MSRTGPAHPTTSQSLPVSPHYARLLADLAYQRGFDGYLLNFEVPLRGRVEQTRALSLWIALLERELKQVVGEHAQVVWYEHSTLASFESKISLIRLHRYDSVIIDGQLRWQDRLNSLNLPFFMPSSSFFTNYTVRSYTSHQSLLF